VEFKEHCGLGQIIYWLLPAHSVAVCCYCVFTNLTFPDRSQCFSPISLLCYEKEKLYSVQTGLLPTNITRLGSSVFLKAVHPPQTLYNKLHH
jgi:hypothetical protein